MKKFVAYLLLAVVVYVLTYAALLGFLRLSSGDIREFCDQLENGMSADAIQASARTRGFVSAINPLLENNTTILFISQPDNPDATCQGLIENGVLSHKKFVLSVF